MEHWQRLEVGDPLVDLMGQEAPPCWMMEVLVVLGALGALEVRYLDR